MSVARGPWRDRTDAGRELGDAVQSALAARGDQNRIPAVLGLPRGGVVVAAEVAAVVGGDLDVLVVRKVGVPWHRELALGAVTASGVRVRNTDVIRRTRLSERDTESAFVRAEHEAAEHEQRFRAGHAPVALADRPTIVVDDGIATGATALAAVQLVKKVRPSPARIILAVPVAPLDTVDRMRHYLDDIIVLHCPVDFIAVGEWFRDFTQVTDAEVQRLITRQR